MLRAAIFDMDGLLLDTEKLLARYWMQAAREQGFPMTLSHVLSIRSLAAPLAKKKLQGYFGTDFAYESIRERRRELTAAHLDHYGIEVKPGAVELLHFLQDKQIATAVATATDRERTEKYLQIVGLRSYFDCLVCGDMVTKGKPDPEIYLTASRILGFAPEDCLALEDSPNGVLSAYTAGCRTVMVPDLSKPDSETLAMLTACVEDLTRVIPLLELLD